MRPNSSSHKAITHVITLHDNSKLPSKMESAILIQNNIKFASFLSFALTSPCCQLCVCALRKTLVRNSCWHAILALQILAIQHNTSSV